MAILFAGGEIESFRGTPVGISGGQYFDSSYARSAIITNYSNPVWADVAIGPTFVFQANLYLINGSLGGRIVTFESGGTEYLRVFPSSNFQEGIWFTNSGGAAEQLISFGSGASVPTNQLVRMRLEVTIDSSAGSIRCYFNDALFGAVSGIDTRGNGPTSFDAVQFRAHFTSSRDMAFSEVIITDGDDTSQMRLKTLVPASAGALQEWNGSTAAMNLTSAGASNLVSASAGEFFLWAHDEAFDAGSNVIKAVILAAAHQLDGTGPSRLRAVQRIGGTNYEAASAGASAASAFVVVMASSLDGSPWDAAKINASQFGWESVA